MLLYEIQLVLDEQQEMGYELFEEIEDEHCLWIENKGICITEHKINVRAGYCETWDEENKEYILDFDFYMIFDTETNELLYEEAGSSLEVCLYNFIRERIKKEIRIDEIENLECVLL